MKIANIQGHQVVCSAFIEKNQKVLIVMCPIFKVWRVPGGRPEHWEKLENTLTREMKEEIWIDINNPIFVWWWQDQQFHVTGQMQTSRLIMFFHVKTDKEVNINPDEADDFKWVNLDELKAINNKESALMDFFSRNSNFKL